MRRRSTLLSAASLAGTLFLPIHAYAAPATVVSAGDASISRDQGAGTWTLAAGGNEMLVEKTVVVQHGYPDTLKGTQNYVAGKDVFVRAQ